MDAQEFMKTLWGEDLPGPVYVWMLPTKKTIWFVNLDHVNRTLSRYQDCDIYTGAGLAPPDNPGTGKVNKRVEQDDVAGLAGLWADIDIEHPAHNSSKKLAPSQEKIMDLLEELPFTPTLVVNSGHGVQAWWVFDRPWIFADREEYWQARTLSQWWTTHIAELFSREGWAVDPVQNLDRVMRVPGTRNNKVPGEPKPVEVIQHSGVRFDRQEFLELVPPGFQPKVSIHRVGIHGEVIGGDRLILDPSAEPPLMKLTVLMEEDEKFRDSWKGQRTDWRAGADHSPSAYDMSLATIAAHAGWEDQEVCDLLICKRRRMGQDLKLRENYYAMTIAKAKQPIQQGRAQEQLDEVMNDEWDDEKVQTVLSCLSILMGIQINRIVRFKGDPPIFWIGSTRGSITIGRIENLTSQTKFRNVVAAATGVLMAPCKPNQWLLRCQAMLNACENEDVGDSSDPATETRAWLNAYLAENSPTDDREQAGIVKAPFLIEERIYIFLERFTQWVEHNFHEKVSSHAMSQRMRHCSAQAEKVNIVRGGRRTSRTCWELPQEYSETHAAHAADPGDGDREDQE